jgi:hypothetical protein
MITSRVMPVPSTTPTIGVSQTTHITHRHDFADPLGGG